MILATLPVPTRPESCFAAAYRTGKALRQSPRAALCQGGACIL